MGSIASLADNYSMTADILTFVMSFLLLFVFKQVSVKSQKGYSMFISIFICVGIGALFNVVFYCIAGEYIKGGRVGLLLTRDVYHVLMITSLFHFLLYCLNAMNVPEKVKKSYTYIGLVTFVVSSLLDVLSPITHFGFYIAADGTWYDSSLAKPYTIANILFYFIFVSLFFGYGKYMFYKIRNTLFGALTLSGVVLVFQTITNNNGYASMTYLFPLIVAMFMMHTNSYNTDTGSLGEDALIEFVSNRKGVYKIYCFVFENYNRDDAGSTRVYFCNFWRKYMNKCSVYFVDNDTLLLIIDSNDKPNNEDYQFMSDSIQGFSEYNLRVSAVMFKEAMPATYDDFKFTLDYAKDKLVKNSAYILSKADDADKIKRKYVLDQLFDIAENNDLHDDRVLVYCQPVKNVHTNKFDTAEALMRLELPEYGMIQPNIFIPLAEKYKLIHYLSLIIFNKVCEAINYFVTAHYEINRISVNFAVQEFRNTEFAHELVKIIKENQIDSNMIAIEVTESENDEEFDILQKIVNQLKELHIHLYLDDFGTGYSNFDRIFGLKLNVIKFDRSFLLMASEDSQMAFLINYFSSAFSQMGYEVLYEGVETEEQEKLCIAANADYLQGFRYGKPIPIYELTTFLTPSEG